MATIISIPTVAPATPADWVQKQADNGVSLPPASSSQTIQASVSSHLKPRTLLPVGPAYLAHVRRAIHNHSFEEHDKHEAARRERLQEADADGAEDDLGVGDEEETPDLLALDPKEWKKQDHYRVLGLSKYRYKATQEQIKVAHRKKVLKHHPDKKAGAQGNANDDDFFKCCQKALEVLSHPEKRRQFDSVDPEFMEHEDDAPKDRDVKKSLEKDPANFVKIFGPIFEREERFSKNQPVPKLGGMDDGKDDVEGFYNFWYNFDSWRSFEYLDKEVNEGSDNRDDKRYTEKKNKSERARRKKEDIARVRGLVDLALQNDPRIRRFKQEEKEAREAKKKGKGNAKGGGGGAVDAETKRKEEAARAKQAEDEAREKAEKKKEKDRKANEAKKARRAQRAQEEAAAAGQ